MISKRLFAMVIAETMATQDIKYLWGGNDPGEGGLDCSGFIRFIFRIIGLFSYGIDITAQGISNTYSDKRVDSPAFSCLAFYGKDWRSVKHVVICRDGVDAIGATAYEGEAKVQIHPIRYRDDLLGYCDPFIET